MKALKTRSLYVAVIAALGASNAIFNSDHSVETVDIAVEPCEGNPEGKVTINKSDFNPEVHTLYKPAKVKKPVSGGKRDGGKEDDDEDKPVFTDMTREEISEWLSARGVKHAKTISGAKLVELAEETYAKGKD